MSQGGDLAEEVAREAWEPFDRQKYDHDELLLAVRENSKRVSDEIAELRSNVGQLETKLSGFGGTLNYVLWIACLLLGAAVFSQIGLFRP